MSIHPGAAIFDPETRRAVADGGPFARESVQGAFVRDDGCCLVGALLREQWPAMFALNAVVVPTMNTIAAVLREVGVITEPIGIPEWTVLADVNDLMERNDTGYYADPMALRQDLLGILAARARPAPVSPADVAALSH